jgi:hypothetical protein
MNVEATLFSLSRRMGIGIVLRNHLGMCLAAYSEILDEVMTMMPELVLSVVDALPCLPCG